ncbi:hypothetical protein GCM10025868_08210 [Angustibacter aerolatus]|uniref:Aldehyde dehydrogenase domain-containing protein n=1 Tax=Angustibacter aerolatus TaxID=1162965 RepID=A0ABQ6JBM0_9ACTN|nr:hypothetical protein GCM10025868_08210 [Angustibacter aerolatus]
MTPLTALLMAEAGARAGLPAGVLNVVTGAGPDVGEHLVAHPGVAMVSFTGGSAVGRRVMSLAAGSAKRVHLELGGKAPFVVFDDADLEAAVHGAVAGALINTGQDCTAATRAIVHRSLHDDFVAGVADLMRAVRLGDPLDDDTDQGPLISRVHQGRVAAHVERARAEGAKVVCGGAAPGGALAAGAYYEPTLVAGIDRTASIWRDEVFGPVLCVVPFDDDDTAIEPGERHRVRPRRLGLDARRRPRRPCHPRDPGRVRLGQRPHPDHQRDAARRRQGVRLRQGHERLLAGGVHERQARDDRPHRHRPQALAPHGVHRPHHHPRRLVRGARVTRRPPQDPLVRQARGAGPRRHQPSCVPRRARGAGAAAALAACAPPTPPVGGAVQVKPPQDLSETEKIVKWANWTAYLDYDDDTKKYPTLEAFTKETGIRVDYSEDVDDNDNLLQQDRAAACATGRTSSATSSSSPTGWRTGSSSRGCASRSSSSRCRTRATCCRPSRTSASTPAASTR